MEKTYPASLQAFKEFYKDDFDFSKISDETILVYFEIAEEDIAGYVSCLGKNKLKLAFMSLVAYYLELSFQKGGEDSESDRIVSSEHIDDVSVSYAIPEEFIKNTTFYFYYRNRFGKAYVAWVYPCSKKFPVMNTLDLLRKNKGC